MFDKPFVIKHVVNLGMDYNESLLLTVAGLNQFQELLNKDGYIYHQIDLGVKIISRQLALLKFSLITS